MNQMAKGLPAESASLSAAEVTKELESPKWKVWHGNVIRALAHRRQRRRQSIRLLASAW
jgi:hypothetical protein